MQILTINNYKNNKEGRIVLKIDNNRKYKCVIWI